MAMVYILLECGVFPLPYILLECGVFMSLEEWLYMWVRSYIYEKISKIHKPPSPPPVVLDL